MSPIHVIVGQDPRAEAMWAQAFAGGIDLYRFDRNIDAFERLTIAEAPIDLVVLTPAQGGPFNLTPDQFVARVLEGPLGSSPNLANLHVLVVGGELTVRHPRAMRVSTLDAAIRLVKFGEVERAPRAVLRPAGERAATRPADPTSTAPAVGTAASSMGGGFSDTIISRIWSAADAAADAAEEPPVTGGGPQAPVARTTSVATQQPEPEPEAELRPTVSQAEPRLFSRTAPAGFIMAPTAPSIASTPTAPAVAATPAAPAQLGAPGESVEVASGPLQPARPYTLPHGGGYRGSATRSPHGAINTAGQSQPVPPAIGAQVQSLVYGHQPTSDPVMTWSSSARGQVVAHGVPVPTPVPLSGQPTMPAAPAQQVPAAPIVPTAPAAAPAAVRTVPLEPPMGAYPGAAAPAAPAAPADPFLARAEAGDSRGLVRMMPGRGERGATSVLAIGIVIAVAFLIAILAAFGSTYVAHAELQQAADVAAASLLAGTGDAPRARAIELARSNGADRVRIEPASGGRLRIHVEREAPAAFGAGPMRLRAEAFVPVASIAGDAGPNPPGIYSGPLESVDFARVCPAVARAYRSMEAAAARDGVILTATSGFRTYAEQAALYASLGPGLAAPPGASRHHDATELDIAVGPTGSPAHRWLQAHGPARGFIQRYSWEPWHWGNVRGC